MTSKGRVALDDQLGLEGLAECLRAAKIPAGASEMLDASRLLLRLARTRRAPTELPALAPLLRPVFCKRIEETARFDAAFKAWLLARARDGDREPEQRPDPVTKTRPTRWTLSVPLLVALIAIALYAVLRPHRVEDTGDFNAATPVSGAVSNEPESAVSTQSAPVEAGYFPAVRYNRELRPQWFFGSLILIVLPLLLIRLPAAMLARRVSRSGRRVQLDTRRMESEAQQLVPQLQTDAAARLSRHIRGRDADPRRLTRRPALDVRRTLEATARSLGVPTLRYRYAPLRPSYMMLIDGEVELDPRTRLFYQWAKRLMYEGWEVEIRLFRPSRSRSASEAPRIYRIENSGWSESRHADQALDHLEDPPFGQRLLVLTDGESLTNAEGQLLPWVSRARFKRWRERVVFTPTQMRQWGDREVSIEQPESASDPGFLVLPLDEPALDAWSLLLSSGKLFGFTLSEPERYPRLLMGRDTEARAPAPPLRELDTLIAQLKLYLGDTGFRWLAAIAVPPLVRWELTLLIGSSLVDMQRSWALDDPETAFGPSQKALLLSVNYRRLTRLPWLRRGSLRDGSVVDPAIPDWLRLRLLHELPPAAATRVRDAVRRALSLATPKLGGKGLSLDLELPPSTGHPSPAGARNDRGDRLYLGYMSGLSARQLAMQAPTAWSAWLEALKLSAHARGVRSSLRWLRDWARASWSRLAFRDGSSASGMRTWGSAVFGGAIIWLAALVWLSLTNPKTLPQWFERAFFEERAHGVGLTHFLPADIAFSVDGKRLFSMDEDGELRVLDADTGKAVTSWWGPTYAVESAEFNADASRILTRNSHTAEVWDVAKGVRLMTATTLGEPLLSATLSAYGSRLATAVGTVAKVWDVETGAELARLAHAKAVVAVALDTEGDRAATVSLDNTLRIFDAASGNLVRTSFLDFSDSELKQLETARNLELLALSPDGSRVAVARPNAGRNTESTGPRLKRGWSSFTGPRGVIDATPSNRGVTMFDASTGAQIAGNRRSPVIATSPDGRRYITSSGDTLTVIDSTSLRTLSVLDTNLAPSARFSPDGSKLVVRSSREPSARLWLEGARTDSGERWHAASRGVELFPRDDNRVTPPDVSPDVTRDWQLALSRLYLDHRWLLPALLTAALALAALFERLLLRPYLARYEHG